MTKRDDEPYVERARLEYRKENLGRLCLPVDRAAEEVRIDRRIAVLRQDRPASARARLRVTLAHLLAVYRPYWRWYAFLAFFTFAALVMEVGRHFDGNVFEHYELHRTIGASK